MLPLQAFLERRKATLLCLVETTVVQPGRTARRPEGGMVTIRIGQRGRVLACLRDLQPGHALEKTSITDRSFDARTGSLLCAGEDGAALVEFALVLPIFLLVMLGIFKFGFAFSNQLTLTQAVGTGAQYLQQIRTNTTDPCRDTFTKIKGAAPYLDVTKLVVSVTMNGTTPSQSGNSCLGAQTNLVQGAPVSVATTYPCDLTIYGINFAPGCLLHAKVTEYEY